MNSIHTYGFSAGEENTLRSFIENVLIEIKQFYRYDAPLTVLIFNAWTFYGVDSSSAYSYKDEVIEIHLDATQNRSEVETSVRLTLYHEFAHIIRYHDQIFGERLIDALVLEGISAVIEESLAETPFFVAPIKDEESYFAHVADKLLESNFDYNTWFGGTGEFPNWFGYRIGYLLMKEFMAKKKVSVDELVRIKSDEVLNVTRSLLAS